MSSRAAGCWSDTKVCRYDQGNSAVFICPYHGWGYSTDRERVAQPGAFVSVPRSEEGYGGSLDREAWSLERRFNVVNYKGTVWANWDSAAIPFEDYRGDMRMFLDCALDHRDGSPGGSEVIGGVQKWRVRSNRKLSNENFVGDLYHEVSHQSANLAEIRPL